MKSLFILLLSLALLTGCSKEYFSRTEAPPAVPPPVRVKNGVILPASRHITMAVSDPTLTVGTLPEAPIEGQSAIVSDGLDASDCTCGEGTITVECLFSEGVWVSKIVSGVVLTNEASLYTALSDVEQFYEPGDLLRTYSGPDPPASCITGEIFVDTDELPEGALCVCINNLWVRLVGFGH